MTIIDERYIVAENLSEGWLDAVRSVSAMSNRKGVHLLIRILKPGIEDPEIRTAAQGVIDDYNACHAGRELPDIETTRNTIFPAAWAGRLGDPSALSAHYRERPVHVSENSDLAREFPAGVAQKVGTASLDVRPGVLQKAS